MSEYPIPEDLQEMYAIASQKALGGWSGASVVHLIERIAKQDAEIERLNKMRTHCENCGADYMATGIEAGCSCKLAAENTSLKEQVERLEKANIKLRGILTSISAVFATIESCTFVNQRLTASEVLEPLQAQLIEVLIADRAAKEKP